jgi:hypothetical protein
MRFLTAWVLLLFDVVCFLVAVMGVWVSVIGFGDPFGSGFKGEVTRVKFSA